MKLQRSQRKTTSNLRFVLQTMKIARRSLSQLTAKVTIKKTRTRQTTSRPTHQTGPNQWMMKITQLRMAILTSQLTTKSAQSHLTILRMTQVLIRGSTSSLTDLRTKRRVTSFHVFLSMTPALFANLKTIRIKMTKKMARVNWKLLTSQLTQTLQRTSRTCQMMTAKKSPMNQWTRKRKTNLHQSLTLKCQLATMANPTCPTRKNLLSLMEKTQQSRDRRMMKSNQANLTNQLMRKVIQLLAFQMAMLTCQLRKNPTCQVMTVKKSPMNQ